MQLDLDPVLEELTLAEQQYGKYEAELLNFSGTAQDYIKQHQLPESFVLELGATLAAHQQMVVNSADAEGAAMPRLTMTSMLASEAYLSLLKKYPEVTTEQFRRSVVVCNYVLLLSPIQREVELMDAEHSSGREAEPHNLMVAPEQPVGANDALSEQ